MNDMNRKEAMNELFDSTLVTLGAVGVGMVTMDYPLQHLLLLL